MITNQDINKIFSDAYSKASLADNRDMRLAADLFESIRPQLDISDPYTPFDFVILDSVKFNNDYCLELLLDLKGSYLTNLFEKQLTFLDELFKMDKTKAQDQWKIIFADAAVHFKEDLLCLLSYQRNQWKINDDLSGIYDALPALIRESRWPDTYTFYKEIAEDRSMSGNVRASAEIALMQIILYFYADHSKAKPHLKNAAGLLPGHFMIKKAEAEYLLATGEIQKSRDALFQVIAQKPGDYISFCLMGDCFKAEGKLDNAEYWYEESVKKNFLQPDAYKRILNLYGDKSLILEKETVIPGLLDKIRKREGHLDKSSFIKKYTRSGDCFKNLLMYECYRDVAASWYGIKNFERSEEWYLKALDLHPEVNSAVIDLAYVKLEQNMPEEALEYFQAAKKNDKDQFEVYMGLAYYYETQGQKDEALKNYDKCLHLRPGWNDWTYNLMGNLLYANGEFKESEKYYRKAVDLNDGYRIFSQNLAGALEEQAKLLAKESKFEEAEKLYRTSLAVDDDAIRWNAFGNFYYNRSMWQEALDCYDKAIVLNSTDPVFHENRGLALEQMNEMDKAEQSFKQAVELDNDSGSSLNRLGIFYYNRKEYEKSVEYYKQAIEREPGNTVFLENICLSYELMGKQELAEPYYLKIEETNPDNDSILNRLGVTYYKKKNYEKALYYYKRAISYNAEEPVYFENLSLLYREQQKYTEAIEYLQKALDLDPENDVNRNNMGVIYFYLENYDKAIENYKQAVELNPDVALYYENIASSYDMKLQTDKAFDYYEKALKIDPENSKVYNSIGMIYFRQKQFDTAITNFLKAVKINPDISLYYENIAVSYEWKNQIDEALKFYEKALEAEPDNAKVFNAIGLIHFNKMQFDEAIINFKKAFELDPEFSLYCQNIAVAYDMKQDYETALKFYNKALSIDPENPKIYDSLGLIYLKMNKTASAIASFRKSVSMDENNGIFMFNLGKALSQNGLKEEAKIAFQKAIELKDDYYLSWNDLGVLYYEEGNTAEAMKCYNRSIELNPDDPVLYANLALLYNYMGKKEDALNITSHPSLKSKDVRKALEAMLKSSIPDLF